LNPISFIHKMNKRRPKWTMDVRDRSISSRSSIEDFWKER
jgi:hypothetical protein